MKKPKENNVAYIDGANLHNGVKTLPWNFDYAKFRIWLLEKYSVVKAYMFLGWINTDKNKETYEKLKSGGYILIFKETLVTANGKVKGNCDADLIVLSMQHLYENLFDKAIIVSSDGDYTPLVKLLIGRNKMEVLVSPYGARNCSILLKRSDVKIVYLEDQKTVLETDREEIIAENKKAPDEDKTS